MKKLLAFVISALPLITFSQNYFPLLDSVNRWTFTSNFLVVAPENINCPYPFQAAMNANTEIQTSGDTSINGLNYKKLITSDPCDFGYIREDSASKKVYFMNNIFAGEVLIYDFGMLPGDSLSLQFLPGIFGISYWENGYYRLDSIVPTYTVQGNRNAYYLNCHTCTNSHSLQWIEGIGNLANPVYIYSTNDGGTGGPFLTSCSGYQNTFSTFLICFSHDQINYFDSCSYSLSYNSPVYFQTNDSCHYYSTMSEIDETDFSASVKVSNNPFTGTTKLEITDESVNLATVTLYNYSGNRVCEKKLTENSIMIDWQNLANGIYIFRMTDNHGRVATGKFPVE